VEVADISESWKLVTIIHGVISQKTVNFMTMDLLFRILQRQKTIINSYLFQL